MLKKLLPPLIPFVLVTLALEWMVRSGVVAGYLVPAPSAVFRALLDNRDELAAAMAKTSTGALVGFALSTLSGIVIAVLLLAVTQWRVSASHRDCRSRTSPPGLPARACAPSAPPHLSRAALPYLLV